MNKNFLKTRKWKEKYVWDSGALVQNSPDGPKCQGRAHTVTERFLGATARGAFLETAPSSICGNVWPRWTLTLAPEAQAKPQNHLAKKNSHYDWKIKRNILNTSFQKIVWLEQKVPRSPTPSAPLLFFLHLNKSCWRADREQPKTATKEGRYESSQKCHENIPGYL